MSVSFLIHVLQVVLLLQDFLHLLRQHAVLSVILFEEGLQNADVLREGDVPFDGGEVLALCQLLVQTPEDVTGSVKSPPGGETAPTMGQHRRR